MTDEEKEVQISLGTAFKCCLCNEIKPTSEQYQFIESYSPCCKDCFTSTIDKIFPRELTLWKK